MLTLLPRIWLIAALSFSVHSFTTLALFSFMYSMKAFNGFFMCGCLFCCVLVFSSLGGGCLFNKKAEEKSVKIFSELI